MKTIGDLFEVNTKGICYEDISIYIYNKYKCPISNVFSDSGYDITFVEGDSHTYIDEYEIAISMSDVSQVFCQNKNINRDTIINIYQDDNCMNVDRIEFDFSNSIIYLIIE